MTLMVIGGNSRLGQAIVRACPSAVSMVRGSVGSGTVVAVTDYHAAVAADFAGYDAVINCTGLVRGDTEALHAANARLPAQLAVRAGAAGVRHFIHVSSFSVHGRAEWIDGDTPIRPTGRYGRSKAEGERALLGGGEAEKVSIVRLPMLYGEGESKLARLVRAWARLSWWPGPKGDIARAMMHYDLAASLLARLAAGRPLAAVAAADVEPFSYALAQSAIRSAGKRAAFVALPRWTIRALKVAGGDRARALFADSRLSETGNLAAAMGLPSRLRSDITALVPR